MRLKTLTLNNFKRHVSLQVDFHSGSNAIMGPNYTGKSTILEAVLVLLWGNKGGPVPADQLVNDGAKDFSIEGTFTNGITIRRTSRDSSVSRDGEEPYARGHTAVNKAIEELLGMDRNTFMRVFASKQGSPQQILEMEGMELQRFVEGCIKLDTLDAIVKSANRKVNENKFSMEAYEALMLEPDDLQRFKDELTLFKSEVAGLESITSISEKAIETMRSSRDRLQTELSNAVAHNRLVDDYARVVSVVESYGDIKEPILVSPKSLEDEIANLSEVERSWQAHAKSVSTLRLLQGELDKTRSNAPADPEPLQDTGFLEADIDMLLGEVRETETKIKSLEELFRNARCPTCKRNFELTDEEIEEKRVELEKLRSKYDEYSLNLADSRQKMQQVTQHNSKQEKMVRLKELYQQQLEGCERRLAEHVLEPEPALDLITAANLMADTKARLSKLLAEQAAATAYWRQYLSDKAKLQALADPGPAKPYEALHEKLQKVTADLDSIVEGMGKDTARLGHLRMSISTNQGIIDRHMSAAEQVELKSVAVQRYRNIHAILSDNRNKIVSDAMNVVFATASEFVSSCTDGDISEVLFHEGSLAYKEGERIRFKGSASGAQKTLMGVGMKLGLSRLVLTPFDCLLLDEVSADMDDEISMRCMLALSSFGQSIFVSHRQMDVADQVIMLER